MSIQGRFKKNGLGGIFEGLGSLVEGLGELMEKLEAEGGELRREGQLDTEKGGKPIKAVYGFSLRMGLGGGKPRVEHFGNVHRGKTGEPVVSEHREPLVDVLEEAEQVLVIAELPGLSEKDIQLELNGDILTLKAEGGRNKFYKEILLPCRPAAYTSSLNNGILEVRLPRARASGEQPRDKTPARRAGETPSKN